MTDQTEPTTAQAERDIVDDEAEFAEMGVESEPFIETQSDPLGPALEPGEPDHAAIAQAHAQFLANAFRSLLDRFYGLKVASGELPAEQLMPRIQAELDAVNATLTRLTEQGGFAAPEQ